MASASGVVFLPLCLLHREIRQGFQQFHSQVLFHILVYGQLVDHGGIVFNHLLRGPRFTRYGGLDRGAVQQHFLFGHPLNTSFIVFIQHTTEAPGNHHQKNFSTHLEACSGGDWIICPACPPTIPKNPCNGGRFDGLNA